MVWIIHWMLNHPCSRGDLIATLSRGWLMSGWSVCDILQEEDKFMYGKRRTC